MVGRGRTTAPPFFVRMQCPCCYHVVIHDAYAGVIHCLGWRNGRDDHRHASTPMVPVQFA